MANRQDIRFDVVLAYARRHNWNYQDLCRMVREATKPPASDHDLTCGCAECDARLQRADGLCANGCIPGCSIHEQAQEEF